MLNVMFEAITASGIFFILMFALEEKVEKLPKTNRFKRWWRNHVIGEDIYGN
jgi:hypothetical protein